MTSVTEPLTISTAVASWRPDPATLVPVVVVGAGYLAAWRRARARDAGLRPARAACFVVLGLGTWAVAGTSMVGVYSGTLFWVRALQVLLLLYVTPFGLAAGRPVAVLRAASGETGRARLDRLLSSRVAVVLTFPAVTSMAVLITPWLLFLTPWLEAVLRGGAVDAVTRLLLVCIGFAYFYTRLQTDPVPRRYSQLISLVITIFESIADGVLGIVLWLGPLVAAQYYQQVGRTWGPSLRTDQTIGAGVLWLLGDVLGLPFLIALMRAFALDERAKGDRIDAELDATERDATERARRPIGPATAGTAPAEPLSTGLWWHDDPQLRERFGRR